MCPSFRISDKAELSTGGRVKLLKSALNGEYGKQPFNNPELAAAMDLCVSCKGCKRECENEVDMALIKAEFMAQRFSAEGVPLRNRLFASLPRLLAGFPIFARLIKWRNQSSLLARLGDRLLGISADVKLPVPANRRLLLQSFSRRRNRLKIALKWYCLSIPLIGILILRSQKRLCRC